MCENTVTNSDIHVAEGVDNVKKNEVDSDNDPVLVASEEEREEEGRSKGGDVNEVFLEVLDEGG